SGSGAAAAEEVKASAPIVIAPKAAATSFAFSLAELNIVVPCYLRPCAPVPGASLATQIQVNRFGTFARNRQNGFVDLTICFVAAVGDDTIPGAPIGLRRQRRGGFLPFGGAVVAAGRRGSC